MFNNQRGSIVAKLALYFLVAAVVYGIVYSFVSISTPGEPAILTSTIFAVMAFTVLIILDLIANIGSKKKKK